MRSPDDKSKASRTINASSIQINENEIAENKIRFASYQIPAVGAPKALIAL